MGQPEPQAQPLEHPDPVTWIGRDRAPSAPLHPPQTLEPHLAGLGDSSPAFPLGPRGRRWAIGIALAIVALGVFAAVRYSHKPAGPGMTAYSIPMVTAIAPGLNPVTAAVRFDGTLQARYDMAIGSEGETGRIVAVYVEVGDHVRKGQLLAQLDDSILRPQVERLAATLEEVRANAALAEAEYARARGVEAAGALSAEDIQKRRATAVTSAAEVKVAAAQLDEYRVRLSHTQIRAPADGVVLTRAAEIGQIATPGGTALFHLARGGEIELRGQAAEQDLPSLAVGQPATVRLTGLDRVFRGRVRLLGATIDQQTRLGEVRIELPPDPALRPGAFARAEVITGQARRPVLPQTAVLADEHGAYVYVVGPDGRVEHRSVRIADSTADGIVIGSGLDGHERVVTTAAAFLRPGERVKLAPSGAP